MAMTWTLWPLMGKTPLTAAHFAELATNCNQLLAAAREYGKSVPSDISFSSSDKQGISANRVFTGTWTYSVLWKIRDALADMLVNSSPRFRKYDGDATFSTMLLTGAGNALDEASGETQWLIGDYSTYAGYETKKPMTTAVLNQYYQVIDYLSKNAYCYVAGNYASYTTTGDDYGSALGPLFGDAVRGESAEKARGMLSNLTQRVSALWYWTDPELDGSEAYYNHYLTTTYWPKYSETVAARSLLWPSSPGTRIANASSIKATVGGSTASTLVANVVMGASISLGGHSLGSVPSSEAMDMYAAYTVVDVPNAAINWGGSSQMDISGLSLNTPVGDLSDTPPLWSTGNSYGLGESVRTADGLKWAARQPHTSTSSNGPYGVNGDDYWSRVNAEWAFTDGNDSPITFGWAAPELKGFFFLPNYT